MAKRLTLENFINVEAKKYTVINIKTIGGGNLLGEGNINILSCGTF